MSEIGRVIEKEKTEREEVIPDDPLLEYFDKATDILDFNYELQKEQGVREFEQFKRDYNLDKLVDKINNGKIPEQLEFYFGGENENLFAQLLSLSPTPANANFLDFLSSDFGAEIMRQNDIHIETGNLYYDNMNTSESIYEFIVSQQDETQKINANLYYGSSFENYLKEHLAGIDADTDVRFDTLTNKNIKHLF